MDILEELVDYSIENLSPSRYLIILRNDRIDIMNNFFHLLERKLGGNPKKFSLVKLDKMNERLELISERKEKDQSLLFVFYDPFSHFYNAEKENLKGIIIDIDLSYFRILSKKY